MLWQRRPKLKDVQERPPALPSSRKTVFFAPHTNEHPAVMPLISKLSQSMGNETLTYSIEDMRESVMSISYQLARKKFSKKEIGQLEDLFRMKDVMSRLGVLDDILTQHPDANVIEMHALPGDYCYSDRFRWADEFFRIPGTRILYLRDMLQEYQEAFQKGMNALGEMENGLGGAVSLLRLEHVNGDLAGYLERLRLNLGRMLLIEIPAPAKHYEERAHTTFERMYGMGLSMTPTLSGRDVQALLDTLTK